MKAKSLEACLLWYARVSAEGLPPLLAQNRLSERICASRLNNQDRRLGEDALLFKRLTHLLSPLTPDQRALLFGTPPEGSGSRHAFYKRRVRLIRNLIPRFLEIVRPDSLD